MNDFEISRTPELIGAEIRTLTTQAQSITLWFGIEIGRKLAAPGVGDFSAAFKRAQTELQAMADALAKITDPETASKLRRAANAVLDSFGPKFKEG